MTLDKSDKALIQLLRAGIYDDASCLEGFPSLTDGEWDAVYNSSKRQTVSGVVFHGLSMLPDEKFPPYALLLRWVARTHRIENASERMGTTLARLLGEFERGGLQPVLQKGHAVARFYHRPSLRVCGDIDLFFNSDELSQAARMVRDKGVTLRHAPDGSAFYVLGETEVEHHSSLIQLHSPLHRRAMNRILCDTGLVSVDAGIGRNVTVLAPLAELLMINVHIMKHCFGTGIGLRHFCDYALAYRALMPGIGDARYYEACRSLGILRWTDILHRFINSYLSAPGPSPLPVYGMKESAGAKAVARLLSMVLEGGNFGLYRNSGRTRGPLFRKFGTFSSFLRHSGLSVRIAPSEALWIIMKLACGQVHV